MNRCTIQSFAFMTVSISKQIARLSFCHADGWPDGLTLNALFLFRSSHCKFTTTTKKITRALYARTVYLALTPTPSSSTYYNSKQQSSAYNWYQLALKTVGVSKGSPTWKTFPVRISKMKLRHHCQSWAFVYFPLIISSFSSLVRCMAFQSFSLCLLLLSQQARPHQGACLLLGVLF